MKDPTKPEGKYNTKSFYYLSEALITLLCKKSYQHISVKDLVQKAGISRTAFYAGFSSKDDFTNKMIIEFHKNSARAASSNHKMRYFSESTFVDYYIRFFTYIKENKKTYSVMLGPNGLPQFRAMMKEEALKLWKDKFIVSLFPDKLSPAEQLQIEMLYHYIVSAHIGIIEYWFECDLLESPEYMAHQLYKMTWHMIKMRYENETADLNKRE